MRKINSIFIFALSLALSACSYALNEEPNQCKYTDKNITSEITKSEQIKELTQQRRQASQGDERVLEEKVILANGDIISIRHSYCYMYNYDLSYTWSSPIKSTSLVESFPILNDFISKSYAKTALTTSLSEILLEELSMSQKMLRTDYDIGLSNKETTTSENVEMSVKYTESKDNDQNARFHIYIGIGGL